MHVTLTHYLILSAILFSLGLYGVVTRKNAILILMGIELILNSANINLVAFSRFSSGNLDGQIFAIFIIVIAAAEAAIGLAIVLSMYRLIKSVNLDQADTLKG
jgi:NADH-quinone oxidoreductase subunit K